MEHRNAARGSVTIAIARFLTAARFARAAWKRRSRFDCRAAAKGFGRWCGSGEAAMDLHIGDTHRACSAPTTAVRAALLSSERRSRLFVVESGEARWIFISARPSRLQRSTTAARGRLAVVGATKPLWAVVGAAKPTMKSLFAKANRACSDQQQRRSEPALAGAERSRFGRLERRSAMDLHTGETHRACSAPQQRREPALAVVGAPKPLWRCGRGESAMDLHPARPIALAALPQRGAARFAVSERRGALAVVGGGEAAMDLHPGETHALAALQQQRREPLLLSSEQRSRFGCRGSGEAAKDQHSRHPSRLHRSTTAARAALL